jgi:hypothetical protein
MGCVNNYSSAYSSRILTSGKTTNTVGSASRLEETTKELSGRGDVRRPSKPACVTGVEIEVDVGLAEFLDRINDAALVDILGSRAARVAEVGNYVAERIGLNNRDHTDLRVLCVKTDRE